MRISVVVPVRDGAAYLERTLPALVQTLPQGAELIVADDGSRDGSADVARGHGAQVVEAPEPAGPAAARNRGASSARGDVLVFLDADVRVQADTIPRLLAALEEPGVSAAFGSYDDAAGGGTVSRYKNLAHHFVHQRARREASTFWAGCGAVRADAFRVLGGFDESYRRPSIEDVELGYRLRTAGHAIRLVPEARVTHLKEWTFASWLVSDVRDRALPWARLVRAGRGLPRDLNFTAGDRAATALVAASLAAVPLAAEWPAAGFASVAGLLAAATLDWPFIRFAARRSAAFAAAAAALHLLHRAAGGLGFAVGLALPARTSVWRPGADQPKIAEAAFMEDP